MGALLGLAALATAIIVGLRLLQRRAAERAQPGRSPDAAISIADYGEIDLAIRLHACPCGGRYQLRGEGPGPAQRQRVAHLECRRCERQTAMYFDLTGVLH